MPTHPTDAFSPRQAGIRGVRSGGTGRPARWRTAGRWAAFAVSALLATTGAALPAQASSKETTVTLVKVHRTRLGTILVTPKGYTLYRYTPDGTHNKATCTGTCASLWPPLLVPKGDKFRGGAGVGRLGTATLSDGQRQVTYHGMPLYRYQVDTSPGQTNGQGVGGVWWVVKAAGAKSSGAGATTTTSQGGGYGY
jgi:predicted lipoprotein with Yx(FWY)xxD motif